MHGSHGEAYGLVVQITVDVHMDSQCLQSTKLFCFTQGCEEHIFTTVYCEDTATTFILSREVGYLLLSLC